MGIRSSFSACSRGMFSQLTAFESFVLQFVCLTVSWIPFCLGGRDILSPKRFTEYNQLIVCFSRITFEFQECNNWAKNLAETYLESVENVFGEESKILKLTKCCSVWVVRDCWLKSARRYCPASTVELMRDMPNKFIPELGEYCADYGDGDFNCKLPLLLGIATLVMVLILVTVIAYLTIHVLWKKKTLKEDGTKSCNGDAKYVWFDDLNWSFN